MRTFSQICVIFVDLEKGLRVLWVAERNRFTGSYFSKMIAYCVVCGMGSRVIALLGGAVTDFLPFHQENAPGRQ